MTDQEKKTRLTAITGEADDTVLSAFLAIAKEKILRKAYPFKEYSSSEDVPEKYENVQIEIAVYLLNKRGAEGETYHSENGINRSYENASVPDSMLKEVMPTAGVL